jgi:hypothetical protein
LVRQIDEAMKELDLAGLFGTYGGRGSKALRPDLLLRLVLYETQCGRHSPAQWFRDSRENEPVQWLLFGMKPSRVARSRGRGLKSTSSFLEGGSPDTSGQKVLDRCKSLISTIVSIIS